MNVSNSRATVCERLPPPSLNRSRYRVYLRNGLVFSGIFSLLATITGAGTALLIYFGGVNVLAGAITAGGWFLFMQSIQPFWFPLTSIAAFWSQFQQASPRVSVFSH